MRSINVNSVEMPTSLPQAQEGRASRSAESLPTTEAVQGPAAAKEGFGDVLEAAVKKVDGLQVAADVEAQKLAGGDGNLHETMLALEKADVAMRVAMKVRTKLVEAYNDVMRMTV